MRLYLYTGFHDESPHRRVWHQPHYAKQDRRVTREQAEHVAGVEAENARNEAASATARSLEGQRAQVGLDRLNKEAHQTIEQDLNAIDGVVDQEPLMEREVAQVVDLAKKVEAGMVDAVLAQAQSEGVVMGRAEAAAQVTNPRYSAAVGTYMQQELSGGTGEWGAAEQVLRDIADGRRRIDTNRKLLRGGDVVPLMTMAYGVYLVSRSGIGKEDMFQTNMRAAGALGILLPVVLGVDVHMSENGESRIAQGLGWLGERFYGVVTAGFREGKFLVEDVLSADSLEAGLGAVGQRAENGINSVLGLFGMEAMGSKTEMEVLAERLAFYASTNLEYPLPEGGTVAIGQVCGKLAHALGIAGQASPGDESFPYTMVSEALAQITPQEMRGVAVFLADVQANPNMLDMMPGSGVEGEQGRQNVKRMLAQELEERLQQAILLADPGMALRYMRAAAELDADGYTGRKVATIDQLLPGESVVKAISPTGSADSPQMQALVDATGKIPKSMSQGELLWGMNGTKLALVGLIGAKVASWAVINTAQLVSGEHGWQKNWAENRKQAKEDAKTPDYQRDWTGRTRDKFVKAYERGKEADFDNGRRKALHTMIGSMVSGGVLTQAEGAELREKFTDKNTSRRRATTDAMNAVWEQLTVEGIETDLRNQTAKDDIGKTFLEAVRLAGHGGIGNEHNERLGRLGLFYQVRQSLLDNSETPTHYRLMVGGEEMVLSSIQTGTKKLNEFFNESGVVAELVGGRWGNALQKTNVWKSDAVHFCAMMTRGGKQRKVAMTLRVVGGEVVVDYAREGVGRRLRKLFSRGQRVESLESVDVPSS